MWHQKEVKKMKEVQIKHPVKVVQFSYIEPFTGDLYLYCFMFEDSKQTLHSIDKFSKNGKSGNTYKKEEVFHYQYKKTVTNFETGAFESPNLPNQVLENAENYLKGYLISAVFSK